jgi:cytidine deaminase
MSKKHTRDFVVQEMEFNELDVLDQELIEQAHRVCSGAYAPHSSFHVGSAVRLASGKIVVGSNQENMSYPSGLCAERVAFFSAGAQFPNDPIVAASVVTDMEMAPEYFSPCGGCRQVMVESESRAGSDIRFLMQAASGPVLVSPDVRRFLPLTFQLP